MINLQDRTSLIDNPIEVEKVVNNIRLLLAELPWVSHPYHIAHKFYRKENQRSFFYPETYVSSEHGKYTYHRLTPDNDYKGMFFFYVSDELPEFEPNQYNFLNYEVAIIFSCNLKLIDNDKLKLGLFTQELIRDVRRKLSENMASFDFQYDIKRVSRDLTDVYREFSLDEIEQYNRLPLQCFRFDLDLKIQEEC